MSRLRLACAAAGGLAVLAGPVHGQRAPDALLDQATAYTRAFVLAFESIVAEERYVQQTSSPPRTRTLKSDLLFVTVQGAGSMVLRDVFEVDGKPVRDEAQSERLMRLFTTPVRDPVQRASEIAREGARYNLGRIGSLNNPLIALGFLQAVYRPRFRFEIEGLDASVGPTVRMVRFEERGRPTVLRTGANGDLRAHGAIWVDETDGRVVKTRLLVGDESPSLPEVVTTFRHDEALGIDVPAEMRDRYPEWKNLTQGVATYGRFRRFQVRTQETIP